MDCLGERTADATSVEAALPFQQSFWEAYLDQTARESQAGAQLIVWPEANAPVLTTNEAAYVDLAQEIARQNGIYLTLL